MIDVPLDEHGKVQSRAIAEHMKDRGIEEIYASPMKRSVWTANEIAGGYQDIPVQEDPRLCPWDPGKLAGQPVKHVLDDIRALYRDETRTPPGGGEPFRDFRVRWLTRLRELLARVHDKDITICGVTHSRNLQCAMAWVAAGAPDDLSIDLPTMGDYYNGVVTGGELELQPMGETGTLRTKARQ